MRGLGRVECIVRLQVREGAAVRPRERSATGEAERARSTVVKPANDIALWVLGQAKSRPAFLVRLRQVLDA